MLAKVDPLSCSAIVSDPKLNAEKTAAGGRSDIHVDHAILHFKVLQQCCRAIEGKAFASLVFGDFRLALQVPAGRIW